MHASQPTVLAVRACRVAIIGSLGLLLVLASVPAAAQEPSEQPVESPVEAQLPEEYSQRMANDIDDVVRGVPRLRQLDASADVPYRLLDKDSLRTELEALYREEYPADLIAAEDALYTRLGLIGPDDELEELQLALLESQVLAFYDSRTGDFTIVGPIDGIGALERLVIAHEYGHALQDQHWDLEGTRITDVSRSDEILAHQSLMEGDATSLMYDWAVRELSPGDLMQVAARALTRQDERLMRRIPPIMRRQLESPYLDGLAFVMALRGQGDWAAVDAAWELRPRSTEQILHPELYPDEEPVSVELPDVAAVLGPGWVSSYRQTLGEMQIGVWLADGREGYQLLPGLPGPLPLADAAAGWGGDRLVSLDGPDGAWAVVWQTDWDSRRDAREFSEAAAAAMEDLPGASAVSDVAITEGLSQPVLVLVASSSETLDQVRSALGVLG